MVLNHGFEYRHVTGPGTAGSTLLDLLAASYPHSSREVWAERIGAGEVAIDGAPATEYDVLARGQVITWRRPPWDEADVPSEYVVLFEDDALLAVCKPRGVPTLPGGGFLEHTLLAYVRRVHPGAWPVHRLGRHTSGVVLFARSRAAASALSRAWRERAVKKEYRALGMGVATWDRRAITAPIGPVAHLVLGTVHAASPDGKPSRSVVCVLERRDDATLFRVDIETGRPHQVRIHLACAGHPLVGDPLYGQGGLPVTQALPGDGGYLLHAERLGFMHPVSGTAIEITAPVPEELRTSAERGMRPAEVVRN